MLKAETCFAPGHADLHLLANATINFEDCHADRPTLRRSLLAGMPVPTEFLFSAWVGGTTNHDLSIQPVADDDSTHLRLRLRDGDVNTLKLSLSYNIMTEHGGRNCHLASGFVPVADIPTLIKTKRCICLRDNFNRGNSVLISFACPPGVDPDLPHVTRLALRPSALLATQDLAADVNAFGNAIQNKVCSLKISARNAGPSYVNAFTFLHMQVRAPRHAKMQA